MKIAINTKFLRVIALAPFLCLAIWQPAAVSGQPEIKPNVFVSDHRISLGGKTINYTATAGETMLKDEKGKPIAAIWSTAYTQPDTNKDARLPLCYMVVLAGRLLHSI
jgi:carboxypeptidase C (cathepsin A)